MAETRGHQITPDPDIMVMQNGMAELLRDKLQVFADYYNKLYYSSAPSKDLMRQFLNQVDIPVFTEQHKQGLDRDITSGELEAEIQQVKLGKSPGLDGLTVEFLQTFKQELVPYVIEIFRYCLEQGRIPPSWMKVKLVVILKKERDLKFPDAYRPISLLNTNYKILATILANRVSNVTGKYVKEDQTGFIKGENYEIKYKEGIECC